MHDAVSGIEVYLRPCRKSDKEPEKQYPEYEAPRGSPVHTGNPRERYIEAVTDERYQIVTILHPKFNFSGKGAVRIYQNIDDSLYPCGYLEKKRGSAQTTMTDVTTTVQTTIDGTKQLFDLSFSALTPYEQIHSSSGEDTGEGRKQGKIIVEVQRGSTELRRSKRKNAISVPTKTTEKVVVEKGRVRSLKLTSLEEGPAPAAKKKFNPSAGKAGEPIRFIFYYTSRTYFEKLGIFSETLAHTLDSSTSLSGVLSRFARERPSLAYGDNIASPGVSGVADDRDDEEAAPVQFKIEPTDDALNPPADPTSTTQERPKPVVVVELLNSDDEDDSPGIPKIETEQVDKTTSYMPTNTPTTVTTNAPKAATGKRNAKRQSERLEVSETYTNIITPSMKAKEISRLKFKLQEIKIKKRLRELEDAWCIGHDESPTRYISIGRKGYGQRSGLE